MTTLFESTLPAGVPDLLRASDYARYLRTENHNANSRDHLPRSLQTDLSRFEAQEGGIEVLAVMAACVRHEQNLTVQLRCRGRVIPVTIFPRERIVHCPLSIETLTFLPLEDLEVMDLGPPHVPQPSAQGAGFSPSKLYRPLAPLLWMMAMRGPRDTLLPEIGGAASYRVTPSIDLTPLLNSELLTSAIERLRKEKASLRHISEWQGLDRERAIRLLNAIYLQSALIVSRSQPGSSGNSWFGALGQR